MHGWRAHRFRCSRSRAPKPRVACEAARFGSRVTRKSRRRSASSSSIRARTSRKSWHRSWVTLQHAGSRTWRAGCSTSVGARPIRWRPVPRSTCRRKDATCRCASRSRSSCGTSTGCATTSSGSRHGSRVSRRGATATPASQGGGAAEMRPRVLGRLVAIQRVLVQHGLDDIILATHLFRPLRFVFYLFPATWFERRRGGTRGERIRLAFEELGPIFVKFGQALSTRRDLLPADVADELAKLQDRVPPFPGAEARAICEHAYGRAVSEVFETFDEAPLAAASIAQVHTARLRGGQEVVIKVLRPGVREAIERDLEVMYVLARFARDHFNEGHRLRPLEVVREYEKTILDELDLMREAANAAQLRRNFAGSPLLYVPEVYWDYCRPDVMVIERIHGVLISDIDELRRRGANIRRLAENGVEIFFTQVFRHNFFHADMHPGNIFVRLEDPEHP